MRAMTCMMVMAHYAAISGRCQQGLFVETPVNPYLQQTVLFILYVWNVTNNTVTTRLQGNSIHRYTHRNCVAAAVWQTEGSTKHVGVSENRGP